MINKSGLLKHAIVTSLKLKAIRQPSSFRAFRNQGGRCRTNAGSDGSPGLAGRARFRVPVTGEVKLTWLHRYTRFESLAEGQPYPGAEESGGFDGYEPADEDASF